jgi:DNA-binding SARP family transcriptional activator
MSNIKFFLFGKFHIEADDNVIPKIEPRKAEELLVYLLICRAQPQSREHLAEMLWGEGAPEQSKSYLRKALWQLQSFLESCGIQKTLLVDGEWLQVNPDFDFWLDTEVLEKNFKDTQGIRGKDLEKGQAASIKDAVNTYQGDLLEGWYQDWCLYERERLQHLYLAMLDKLMDRCEAEEDYENGLIFGERILRYDRARERTHRRLMRLHYLIGDRTAALRQYQKCIVSLKEELDVQPADRTSLLYEMIRADKLETPSRPTYVHKNNGHETEESLNMLFRHLSSLHKSLSQIQTQIAQDIEVIQKTIKNNHS